MRAAKVDTNQADIVKALRKAGATVQLLHRVGEGCPDLAVGYKGQTYLIEVKDGAKSPSKRGLNPIQVEWHDQWRGHVAVAESIDDALRIIGVSQWQSIGSIAARMVGKV